MAVGAEGFTISSSVAGSAVMHISPQHCPLDECGTFSGADFPFNAIDIESGSTPALACECPEWSCIWPSLWTCCASTSLCTWTTPGVWLASVRQGAMACEPGSAKEIVGAKTQSKKIRATNRPALNHLIMRRPI